MKRKDVFQKSKLGRGREYSFSSLIRYANEGELTSILNGKVSFKESFIDIHEDRKINTRKYKEQMSKNKMKVKIREK